MLTDTRLAEHTAQGVVPAPWPAAVAGTVAELTAVVAVASLQRSHLTLAQLSTSHGAFGNQ